MLQNALEKSFVDWDCLEFFGFPISPTNSWVYPWFCICKCYIIDFFIIKLPNWNIVTIQCNVDPSILENVKWLCLCLNIKPSIESCLIIKWGIAIGRGESGEVRRERQRDRQNLVSRTRWQAICVWIFNLIDTCEGIESEDINVSFALNIIEFVTK